MLHDFGHVDEDGVDRLLLGIGELPEVVPGAPVDIDLARRAAAMLLFPGEEAGASSMLVEDWPLLFS